MIRKPRKVRLDELLVARGIAPSAEKARALIMAGAVRMDTFCLDKVGSLVPEDAALTVRGEEHPYVSRGGLKLQGALNHFGIDVSGLAVLDAGASTGGFTDCLLKSGARRVFAVDVGYGQLDWSLRQDPRVRVIERTNIRYYDGRDIDETPQVAVVDVSFISLKTVLPAVMALIADTGWVLALIKPQFEASRDEVGSDGVVSDPAVHDRVIGEIESFCRFVHLDVAGVCESALRGPAGNREFFIFARKKKADGY